MLELEQIRRYGWADQDMNLAWTVAVVAGATANELVRAYGGNPKQTPQARTFDQAQVAAADLGDYFYVQLLTTDDHIVAIENNGWLGQRAEVAERASQNGSSFVSIYWSLNANYKITQAVDGRIVAHFDPLSVQYPAPVGETYPDWLTDVLFTDDALHSIMLALMEQQSGLAFDRRWLEQPLPTYRIGDP